MSPGLSQDRLEKSLFCCLLLSFLAQSLLYIAAERKRGLTAVSNTCCSPLNSPFFPLHSVFFSHPKPFRPFLFSHCRLLLLYAPPPPPPPPPPLPSPSPAAAARSHARFPGGGGDGGRGTEWERGLPSLLKRAAAIALRRGGGCGSGAPGRRRHRRWVRVRTRAPPPSPPAVESASPLAAAATGAGSCALKNGLKKTDFFYMGDSLCSLCILC